MTPDDSSAARWAALKRLLAEVAELSFAEREAHLDTCSDPTLAAEARALLAAEAAAPGLFDRPAWAAAEGSGWTGVADGTDAADVDLVPDTALGPWRIDGLLGRGGMGTVYRARRADGAFEREVALKLVRGAVDLPALFVRFEAERRILAGLDHPGIARLLDAGSTPGGLPYLVLELVEGEPIDAYCATRALAIEPLLRLFLAVCEAVAFAHQRLVLHRDLKPSNILVEPSGRPKLLDFGIAKVLDPETGAERQATLTRLGLRPLTPAYASPEQLRGEPLSTATDVWSLGVVLYLLLTGRLPYDEAETSNAARAERIETESLLPPSQVVRRATSSAGTAQLGWRRLRGDLDTIVATALAADLGRRYPTVEALADDLRRHLDGRPISARPASAAYRAQRFVTRHRVGVATAAAILLALAAAALFSARQAELARQERDLARQRFAEVRELARFLLHDVHDEVATLPGALAARSLLLDKGLVYLDRLAAQAGGEPELLAELADGYRRLGNLQGRPFEAQRGDTAGALASAEHELALLERLAATVGADAVSAARRRADAGLRAADLELALGRIPEARKRAELALAQLESPASGKSSELAAERAVARARIAYLVGAGGGFDEAGPALEAAAIELETELARRPQDRDLAHQLIRVLTDAATIVANSGRSDALDAATALAERAIELARAGTARDAGDREAARLLARALYRLATTYGLARRDPEALARYDELAALLDALGSQEPHDLELVRQAAVARLQAAQILVDLGRPDEAVRTAALALEPLEQAAVREPESQRILTNLAYGWFVFGFAHQSGAENPGDEAVSASAGRRDACAAYARAHEIYSALVEKGLSVGTDGQIADEATRRHQACAAAPAAAG